MQHSLACVSFLNSKPLIEPLLHHPDVTIHFAVPSALLSLIDSGTASTGLLSLVDFHASRHELLLVPAGAIACDGPTLTVRIFSRVPPAEITTLHADTDSHTSIVLAQIILRELHHATPTLIPLPRTPHADSPDGRPPTLNAQRSTINDHPTLNAPTALLLIGDKVVNSAPPASEYPYQLDLGQQWKLLTGLPFVFACWMMRVDMLEPGGQALADLLAWSQRRGAAMTDALVAKYAAAKRWPPGLARRYFTEYLRYEVTPRGRQGIERFFALATQHHLLTPAARRPLRYLELTPV